MTFVEESGMTMPVTEENNIVKMEFKEE